MLFGKLLEAGNEMQQNDLQEMQQELRVGLDKAKLMAAACKLTSEDEHSFPTNAAGELIYPEFKDDINYNEQFWKTYLKNELSFSLIKDISEKASQLQSEVQKLESLQERYFKQYKMKNRKKNRRPNVCIEKNYSCPYDRCYKNYGSDVSLNLHIKLKHNGGNKTDRQKLAEQICRAEARGQALPEMRLNLPPGYLQQFRKTFVDRIEEVGQDRCQT